MDLERYTDSRKMIWDEFVRQSKNGAFLFFRDYMDYHRDRFFDYSLLVRDDKERLLALLPANKEGDTLVSHEGLTFGGFIVNEAMKTPKMLEVFEATLSYLKQNSFTKLIYKSIPYIYHTLPAEEDRYALFLCNANFRRRGPLAVVSQRHPLEFQERRRRGVKKAIAQGLVVQPSEDFKSYWCLVTEVIWQRHHRLPVHSLEEIELLHSKFPDHIKLFVCFKDKEMLAGVVIYESKQVARAQYIATTELGKTLGALDLIFHRLLTEVYCNKEFFDFGTSDEANGRYLNQGLIDQKEGFGARAVMLDQYEVDLLAWKPGQLYAALNNSQP